MDQKTALNPDNLPSCSGAHILDILNHYLEIMELSMRISLDENYALSCTYGHEPEKLSFYDMYDNTILSDNDKVNRDKIHESWIKNNRGLINTEFLKIKSELKIYE